MTEARSLTLMTISILAICFALLATGCTQAPKAKDGKDGLSPKAPVITTTPANASECPTGGVEVLVNMIVAGTVCNGLQGNVGAIGPTGTQGVPGQDITPVSLIQLCPGTPVYPTTFIEYGICVGNSLYGVYSANGGFLAYLPPGNYTSNGIGSNCDFSILPNCVIQ